MFTFEPVVRLLSPMLAVEINCSGEPQKTNNSLSSLVKEVVWRQHDAKPLLAPMMTKDQSMQLFYSVCDEFTKFSHVSPWHRYLLS